MTITPDMLMADAQLREMLWAFDFAPEDNQSHGPVWADTTPLKPFEIVARRSSGCVYALVGAQRHVLLLTSEGQSGIVAANLQDCVELVVAYPHWADVVENAQGDLDHMRMIFRDDPGGLAEGFFVDDGDVDDMRRVLNARLRLSTPADPGLRLHHALNVLDRGFVQRDIHGQAFAPLFDWCPPR
jgi:hypothetical protein